MKKYKAYAMTILCAFAAIFIFSSWRVQDTSDGFDSIRSGEESGLFNFDFPDFSSLLDSEPEAEEEDVKGRFIEQLTDFASTLLGRKYVWGATGPKNFDCSGFTSYVFRNSGIELPRTSRMQYTQGQKVNRDEIQAGDLMFFSSPRSGRGVVGHVGIVVDVDPDSGQLTFIHASTSKGITYQKFPDGGYYSRNYIGAKRVIDDGIGSA